MRGRHIAFIVESAHGHINPTLAITSKLVQRGYRVSYAVKEYFAPRVIASGADALVYRPSEAKLRMFAEMQKDTSGDFLFDFSRVDMSAHTPSFDAEESDTLSQLQRLYQNNRPDLIVYDITNVAGKLLAKTWGIPSIEHAPMPIGCYGPHQYNENLVIVSLPKFFQSNASELDSRFKFVGPIYNDGKFFKPWRSADTQQPRVLISATTGLLSQPDFFHAAISAFQHTSFHVVLSIGDEFDPAQLGNIPANFEINQFSSQQDILRHCCLFIGHGGVSSTFEALRFGVPVILVPPSQAHDVQARRVEELGLGVRIAKAGFSAEALYTTAASLLKDQGILKRVKQVQEMISKLDGAHEAAELIHAHIGRRCRSALLDSTD